MKDSFFVSKPEERRSHSNNFDHNRKPYENKPYNNGRNNQSRPNNQNEGNFREGRGNFNQGEGHFQRGNFNNNLKRNRNSMGIVDRGHQEDQNKRLKMNVMEERKRKSDENIIDIAGKEDVPFKQLQKIIEHESWEQQKPKVNQQIIFAEAKRIRTIHQEKIKKDEAPTEVSAKLPVPRRKIVIPVSKKKESIDPRYSDKSGKYNESLWNKQYSFIHDIESKEIETIHEKLQQEEIDQIERQKLHHAVNILKSQQEDTKRKSEMQKLKSQLRLCHSYMNRKEELEKIAKTGKQPYYYSDLDLKKIKKERKYEELVRTGKLDSYMQRKLKKKASREKHRDPTHFIHTRNP